VTNMAPLLKKHERLREAVVLAAASMAAPHFDGLMLRPATPEEIQAMRDALRVTLDALEEESFDSGYECGANNATR
jgi:hypothetical protein